MVDYNQALSIAEAMHRGRMLDAENVFWLEEPIRHDDYGGLAKLASELKTPVQIGENFSEATATATAIAAKACDFVMPDLERIGGVSGWQRAAGLAFANGIEMSSHLFPEVSAHLLAATPTAIFWNTSIGPTNSCRSRCASSAAPRSRTTSRATGSYGMPTPSGATA